MQKFKKKPVVIEAVQWDETKETLQILINAGMKYTGYTTHETENFVRNLGIDTLEGTMRAGKGDWNILCSTIENKKIPYFRLPA